MEISDLDSILGFSWLRVWRGADHEAARLAVADARAGGVGRFQGFCPTHKGTPKWWDVVISPLPGADGKPERLVCVGRDITELRHAEQQLAHSESRWRNLLEEMQEGFFIGQAVRDDAGRMHDFIFVDLNPAFEAHTGVATAMAKGRSVRDVIPRIQEELTDTYAKVVDSGEPMQFEVCVPALNDRWFEARVRRMGHEHFSVLFLEISSRKAAEQAVLESETRFRSLAQSMPNHVWTARTDGQLDWFNDRVYAYGGAAHGELDGDRWAAMVHPDDLDVTAQVWANARATGEQYEKEFRLQRYDGVYRWHIARAVPIRDNDGVVQRWIGTNTDIEDQKTAEAALAELAATLEQRVEARTAELVSAQDALRQSQKMESIGNLTGGVAHDFNNLLQVISGNLHLLARDVAGNATAQKRVQTAMAGVSRGAKLASQLLAFGRRQPLAPKVVNAGTLIRNMDDILRRARGEGIEVATIVADGLWNTLIDPATSRMPFSISRSTHATRWTARAA